MMPKNNYDVIIVGSGPAGIFSALELSQTTNLDILLLDKGRNIYHRVCPLTTGQTSRSPCSPCNMVSGWGGAGAFSDGKLTLSSNVGGQLKNYIGVGKTNELVQYVDNIYLSFGASDNTYGIGERVEEFSQKAESAGLRLIPVKIRHLGTEHCREVLQKMYEFLASRVEIRVNVKANSILTQDGAVKGIVTDAGEELFCRHLIVSPGREGSEWLTDEANRLGLTLHSNPVDVGVRVEVPSAVLEELTSTLYESKLEFYSSFGDRIRTFCMCPHGEVTRESLGGNIPVMTVNGHSYAFHKTDNTNFALLVSTIFREPFRDPIGYGKHLARLANIVSGGIIMQRLGDLERGHCSTLSQIERGKVKPTLESATPGDLTGVMPFRLLQGIKEMLVALDKLAPDVASPHTLLYGIEVKFYSSRPELSENLETEINNMFAIGDGAGITRGLVQSSASGVVVAQEISRRVR
jgi:hypothetical protein